MIQPIVIAPTYNNGRMLAAVMDHISAQGLPVLVVNDGSTDDTAGILDRWVAASVGGPQRQVVTHPTNRGKADALRTGFAKALQQGFTHAITIDTDGQLDPTQIADLLTAAEQSPDALIVGDRDQTALDYPSKSRAGRRISNLMVRIESGLHVSDSQCGFRVYPLERLASLSCHVDRYGYETEILTRFAWAGGEMRHVPVRCIYDVPGGRISHLHPRNDTLRGIAMHAWLLVRSVLPIGVRRFDSPVPRQTGTIWHRATHILRPTRGATATVTIDEPIPEPSDARG